MRRMGLVHAWKLFRLNQNPHFHVPDALRLFCAGTPAIVMVVGWTVLLERGDNLGGISFVFLWGAFPSVFHLSLTHSLPILNWKIQSTSRYFLQWPSAWHLRDKPKPELQAMVWAVLCSCKVIISFLVSVDSLFLTHQFQLLVRLPSGGNYFW